MGAAFRTAQVVDLNALLPDCGYKLRSVEFTAVGTLDDAECDACPEGTALVLNVAGGGSQLELFGTRDDLDVPVGASQEVRVVATIEPPFEDEHIQLRVTDIAVH